VSGEAKRRALQLFTRDGTTLGPVAVVGLVGAALVGGAWLGYRTQPEPVPVVDDRPNIIFVLADDLGAESVGAYGSKNSTPNLDQLAAEGMRFETAWATPVCTPTRVELMTGQYASTTGWFGFIGRKFTPRRSSPLWKVWENPTFADVAREAGYVTGLVGKWQLPGAGKTLIREAGFDEYMTRCELAPLPGKKPKVRGPSWQTRDWQPCLVEDGEYVETEKTDFAPELTLEYAMDFVTRHRDEPFLLYVPTRLIHVPHEKTPDPDRPGKKRPGGFANSLQTLDDHVGRLVDHVDRLGLSDRTLIVFSGDNGTEKIGKDRPEAIGARVPFIARWPGSIPAGTVSLEITDFTDFLPTVAELVGGEVSPDYPGHGVSLVPTLRDPTAPHRDWIASFYLEAQFFRTRRFVRQGDGTILDCHGKRQSTKGCELIDDPQTEAEQEAFALFDDLERRLPGPDVEGQRLRPPGSDKFGVRARKAAENARNLKAERARRAELRP
jgi:arylsulfatase A